MPDSNKYKTLLKNIGKEVILLNERYRVIGIYDDCFSMYYICYNGKDEAITLNVFFLYGIFRDDETLKDIATVDNCIENIYKDDESIFYWVEDDVLYAKELFSKPYKLRYIFNGNKYYRFDRDINIVYDHKKEEFKYVDTRYGWKFLEPSYIKLKQRIKKSYIELAEQYLNSQLSDKVLEAFNEDFVCIGEYNGKNNQRKNSDTKRQA